LQQLEQLHRAQDEAMQKAMQALAPQSQSQQSQEEIPLPRPRPNIDNAPSDTAAQGDPNEEVIKAAAVPLLAQGASGSWLASIFLPASMFDETSAADSGQQPSTAPDTASIWQKLQIDPKSWDSLDSAEPNPDAIRTASAEGTATDALPPLTAKTARYLFTQGLTDLLWAAQNRPQDLADPAQREKIDQIRADALQQMRSAMEAVAADPDLRRELVVQGADWLAKEGSVQRSISSVLNTAVGLVYQDSPDAETTTALAASLGAIRSKPEAMAYLLGVLSVPDSVDQVVNSISKSSSFEVDGVNTWFFASSRDVAAGILLGVASGLTAIASLRSASQFGASVTSRVELESELSGTPAAEGDTAAANTTRLGVERNNPGAWRAFRNLMDASGYEDMLSADNRSLIARGRVPIVDDAWIKFFPEDAGLAGETISMHHIQGYGITVPLAATRHLDAHMPGGYRYNPGGPGSQAPFYPPR
jgi:hypothetical protein